MASLPVWTAPNSANTTEFEKWLTSSVGVSSDCYKKLATYGCNNISILRACTESDIEDISNETKIQKIDKLKLKVALKKINDENTKDFDSDNPSNNKHLIIETEERNLLINIDNKIKEFQHILSEIDSTQINHIIVESKKCEKNINDTFDAIYKSLKQRQEILLSKLNDITNNKKLELIKTKKHFNSYLEKSIVTKQECHKLLNKPLQIEQLNDRKQKIKQKAHKILGIRYDDHLMTNNKQLFIFKSYLNSLFKIHSKFGDIYGIKYINTDKWDMNDKGDHILVNNKISVCNIDNEYQSIFGCNEAINGIHHWRLKVIKTTYHMLWNTMIGIIQINNKSKARNTYFTENGHSYAFIGNCSALEPNLNINAKNVKSDEDDEDDQVKYGEMLKNGSVVDIIFDCNKHTLKYIIDNNDYGIAYEHIPVGKYCLAVTMTQKNDQIQLISYCGQQFI